MNKLKSTIQILALLAAITSLLWHGVAALGTRFGFWSIGFGLGTLSREWVPYVLYTSIALGVLSIAFTVPARQNRFAGVVIGLIAITLPLGVKMQTDKIWASARTLPAIHDITTDTVNPPMFTEAILLLRNSSESNPANYIGKRQRTRDGSPGELVADLQIEAYPDIVPIINKSPAEEIFEQARLAAISMGWEIITEDSDVGVIEATDTTFWYGFKDDVIIRVQSAVDGGSIVDVRSLSRIGGSDLGKNASRIREFRAKLIK